MNFDSRRVQLVLALRKAGITDSKVMAVMESIPRNIFLAPILVKHAYEDVALPIGFEQTLSQPGVVGIMTQALDVTDRMKVLEVGTGSGYQTVVLSRLVRRVYTIERHRELLEKAEKRFKELKISNITAKYGDGTFGWKAQEPFDRIMVTAASLDIPPILADQLSIGGIMVVPIGQTSDLQSILKVERTEDGFETEEIREVSFVPLIPAEV